MSSNRADGAGRRRGVEEALVGRALGLRHEIRRRDVEHVLEMVEDAELGRDVLGVAARAVGEDQLAPGQALDGIAEGRIELDRRVVDVVGEVEEVVRVHLPSTISAFRVVP